MNVPVCNSSEVISSEVTRRASGKDANQGKLFGYSTLVEPWFCCKLEALTPGRVPKDKLRPGKPSTSWGPSLLVPNTPYDCMEKKSRQFGSICSERCACFA
jgi:hypothetical protein